MDEEKKYISQKAPGYFPISRNELKEQESLERPIASFFLTGPDRLAEEWSFYYDMCQSRYWQTCEKMHWAVLSV